MEHQRRTILRLLHLLAERRLARNILFALVFARGMLLMLIASAVASTISGPIANRDANGLVLALLRLTALLGASALVHHWRIRISRSLGEAIAHDLRKRVLAHLARLSLRYHRSQKAGHLLNCLTTDVESVRHGLQEVAFGGALQICAMVLASLLMLYQDWRVFAISVAAMIGIAVTTKSLRVRAAEAQRNAAEAYGRLASVLADGLNGVRVALMSSRGIDGCVGSDAASHAHSRRQTAVASTEAATSVAGELQGQLLWSGVLLVSGYTALHGGAAVEVLVSFFFLMGWLLGPIAGLADLYQQGVAALVSAERLFAILDSSPDWDDTGLDALDRPLSGALELQGVSFAYPGGSPVLHSVSLSVRPGQTVALVGPTGSGKSTLLALLLKFYLADEGRVLFDGNDIRHLPALLVRRHIASVLQGSLLFGGTVLDNARLGKPAATDEEILEAARKLEVSALVERFPKGWLTEVGARGSGLSVGERQVVCLIRAMVADPRIVLLDEATSALDPATEQQLQRAFAKLLEGRAGIIVAHRLSTIRHSAEIVVLDQGRVVERGNHEQLLGARGLYYRLHHDSQQASGEASI